MTIHQENDKLLTALICVWCLILVLEYLLQPLTVLLLFTIRLWLNSKLV